MKFISRSAITLILVGSTTGAFAEMENNLRHSLDEVSVVVNFADLNPANPADAQTLLNRVQKAVRKVCQRANAGTSLEALKDQQRCRSTSYENGVAAINAKKSIDVEALAAQALISREIVVAD